MKLFSCAVHFALDNFLGLIGGGGADLVERKMLWTRIKKLSALWHRAVIFWTFCVAAQPFRTPRARRRAAAPFERSENNYRFLWTHSRRHTWLIFLIQYPDAALFYLFALLVGWYVFLWCVELTAFAPFWVAAHSPISANSQLFLHIFQLLVLLVFSCWKFSGHKTLKTILSSVKIK